MFFEVILLLKLYFGQNSLDGSDTHKVQPEIVLAVA